MVGVSKLVFFLHCIPAQFQHIASYHPKMRHSHPIISARLTTSLSCEGTWTWGSPIPRISLHLFWVNSPFCSLPYFRPKTLSDRSIVMKALFHSINISKEIFYHEFQTRSNWLYVHSDQETSHTALCFTRCNFKPTPKLVLKILQIYMAKNEIKLCHMFLGLLWYK